MEHILQFSKNSLKRNIWFWSRKYHQLVIMPWETSMNRTPNITTKRLSIKKHFLVYESLLTGSVIVRLINIIVHRALVPHFQFKSVPLTTLCKSVSLFSYFNAHATFSVYQTRLSRMSILRIPTIGRPFAKMLQFCVIDSLFEMWLGQSRRCKFQNLDVN